MDAQERDAGAARSTPAHALDLGARLRAERLRQGMSLREMARRLGISPSALSQIETGKAQPSVSKLFDIVNLLNTSLDGLLAGRQSPPAGRGEADGAGGAGAPAVAGPGGVTGEPGQGAAVAGAAGTQPGGGQVAASRAPETEGFMSVQRSGEHEVLELESGVQWRRLTAGSLPGVEFLHVTYEPGACSSGDGAFMRHAGQEFGYLVSGRLLVEVGFDAYELTEGDSISFPATTPHRLSNHAAEPAYVIWLVLGRHAR
jgi:quercetin dioxygenase-like cupin family protein/DNA-binding XRE family transcriptional regulator